MEVSKVFRNLVTNTFMPEFDYAGYKFSFKTVFHISDFDYCLCTCGYEHEYLEYISNSGKIDEILFEKIEQCISEGKCPHVDQVPQTFTKEAGIYGVNIAAAVGTWDAFANQSNQISHYGRIYGKKSSLFSLGPYETAIYKNSSFAMMPFMQDFTAKKFPVTHLSAQLTSENPQRIDFEYMTNLAICIRLENRDLLETCLQFNPSHNNPETVYQYTCKHNMIGII